MLTPDDTEVRRRFLNVRGTLEKLLEHDIVPVINENDTVATDEIRYGDNDRLAARVAQTVMADGLILLSDIDGLYTADPRADAAAKFINRVGPNGQELGRGLAAYASDEALAIKGCRSDQIETKLGYRGRSVMVHRDDMVLFSSK